jgi:superfamily I DNA/RNA helicase
VPTSQLHTHTRCRRYEAALRASNAADFDDLLGLAVALLRGSHELRQRYLRRFR